MYKNTLKFAFLGIISGLIFSCQTQDSQKIKTYELVPTDELISLPLNDQTPNISVGLQYFQGDIPYLFNANWNTNAIQLYDLGSKTLIKELVFEKEGDQGIELAYFHVHNLDSIFVFPPFGNQFVLTDTSGKVKNRIRFELPVGYPTLFVHNSYYVSPPNVAGNELIVKLRAEGRLSDFTQTQLDTIALAAAIDLKSGSVRLLPPGFPKDYLANGQKQLEYSFHYEGNQMAVSFLGDHRIYQFPGNSAEAISTDAKSQFLDEVMPSFTKDTDSRGFAEYSSAKSRYESLIFDPFRKVYYRFAFPTLTIESDDQLRALRSTPGPFVVMVLDEKGNVLTERKFEAGTYFPGNYFVGEKGLFISINHPENPKNEEDELKFEWIELRQN
jgi:hypothetical protein